MNMCAVGRVVELLKEKGATYEKDGATYVYQVSGEPGNWHASVHLEGVDAAPSAAAEAR